MPSRISYFLIVVFLGKGGGAGRTRITKSTGRAQPGAGVRVKSAREPLTTWTKVSRYSPGGTSIITASVSARSGPRLKDRAVSSRSAPEGRDKEPVCSSPPSDSANSSVVGGGP